MPVYDDEKTDKSLGELEDMYTAPSAGDEDLPEGHPDRSDNLKDQEEGEKEGKDDEKAEPPEESLEDGLQKELGDAKEADSLYKGGGDSGRGFASRAKLKARELATNKWAVGGAGVGLIGMIVGSVAFFSFLNIFKLEHLLDGVDSQSFARINATFDNRSDKWVRAYVTIRLMEYRGTTNPAQDNLFFKADKVDTNKPLSDWYRTMRTSKFEQEVFEKSGIKFVSVIQPDGNGGIKIVPGSISVKDDTLDFDPLARYDEDFIGKVVAGDLTSINQLGGDLSKVIDQEFYKDNKSARRAIKTAVNDNTNFLQVFRKRHLRKDIQNRIGVSDWKFFETRRNKFVNSKSELQKKMLRKLLPEDTKSGKFLLCIFGAGPCPKNADSVNPETKSKAGLTGGTTESEGQQYATDDQGNVQRDSDGNPIKIEPGANAEAGEIASESVQKVEDLIDADPTGEVANAAARGEILKTLMSKLNVVTSAISVVKTMDMLSRIDHNITNGKLSKISVLAKGAMAAAAYTTYAIARDQARSGDLTADEYNLLMQSLNGAENSEAYDTYFNQASGTVSAQSSKAQYCSETHVPKPNEYVWNCDSTKIGGATNGTKIEEAYTNSSFGKVLHEITEQYRGVRDKPGVKQTFDFTNWISDQTSKYISKITDPIFDAVGITGGVEKAMGWLTEKTSSFLGASPILMGVNDNPGLTMTMVTQGGSYLAESSARASGAAASTPASKAYSDKITTAYLSEQEQSQSLSQRYLATTNPKSLISKSMFALSTLSFSDLGSMGKWVGGALSSIGSIFSRPALAVSDSGGAAFAGIDTYDFPQACIDRDPMLSTTPAELTNADDLKNEAGKPFIDTIDVTMNLLDNQDAFWAKVYERVADNDTDPTTVLKVYNCEALDQRVRGMLGNPYGYKADGGLEDTASGDPGGSTPTPSTGSVVIMGDSLTVGMQTLGKTYPEANYLAHELSEAGRDTTVSAQGCRGLYQSAGPTTGDGNSCPAETIIDGFTALDDPATQAAVRAASTIVVALGTNPTEFVNGKSDDALYKAKIIEYAAKIRGLKPSIQIFWVNLAIPGAPTRASSRNKAIQEVAGTYRITVLDWQGYVNTVNGDDDLTNDVTFNADGVHHDADGYKKKAQFLIDALSGSVQ